MIVKYEPGLTRSLEVLISAAALVVIVAGLRAFSDSLGPLVVALVLVISVAPIRKSLVKRGASPLLAMLVSLVVAFAILIFMIVALIWSGAELASLVASDEYKDSLAETADDVGEALRNIGVKEGTIVDAVDNLDLTTVASRLSSVASGVVGIVSMIMLVFMGTFFMSGDANRFSMRLDELGASRPTVHRAFQDFNRRTQSYMLVSTVFGGVVALLDMAALWAMGIPLAFVWGIVSFITNYIPNVGFLIGVIPPAILGLLEGGVSLMVWVVVVYVGLNFVIQSLIQPRVVGDTVGLSTTLTFVSLLFWGYVFGAIGALMAVPLTLLTRALLVDSDPTNKWMIPLISLSSEASESEGESS